MKTTIISGPRGDFFWRHLLLEIDEMDGKKIGRVRLLLENVPSDPIFRRRLTAVNRRSTRPSGTDAKPIQLQISYLAGCSFEAGGRYLTRSFDEMEKCAQRGENFIFYIENPLRWLLRLDRAEQRRLRRSFNRLSKISTNESSVTLGVNSLTEYLRICPARADLFDAGAEIQAGSVNVHAEKDHPTFILLPNESEPFYERIEKNYALSLSEFRGDDLICLLNQRQALRTTKGKWFNG